MLLLITKFFYCIPFIILFRTNSNVRIKSCLLCFIGRCRNQIAKNPPKQFLLSLHTLFSQTCMCARAPENAQSKLVNPRQFLCEICQTRRLQGASQFQSNARYSVATTKSLARQDTSICPGTKSQTNNFARSRFKKAFVKVVNKPRAHLALSKRKRARIKRGCMPQRI